jgi:hypothetical protein
MRKRNEQISTCERPHIRLGRPFTVEIREGVEPSLAVRHGRGGILVVDG